MVALAAFAGALAAFAGAFATFAGAFAAFAVAFAALAGLAAGAFAAGAFAAGAFAAGAFADALAAAAGGLAAAASGAGFSPETGAGPYLFSVYTGPLILAGAVAAFGEAHRRRLAVTLVVRLAVSPAAGLCAGLCGGPFAGLAGGPVPEVVRLGTGVGRAVGLVLLVPAAPGRDRGHRTEPAGSSRTGGTRARPPVTCPWARRAAP